MIVKTNTKESSINFQLVNIKPNFNQLNSSNFQIEHLIDNIYVIYLINTSSYSEIFLNDIYNIEFKLTKEREELFDVHLCIDTTFENNEDSYLSLIQFDKNIIYLNSPKLASAHSTDTTHLKGYNLGSQSNGVLQFYLNDEQINSSPFVFTIKTLNRTTSRLTYKKIELYENKIEKLQYSIDSIVFDSQMVKSNEMPGKYNVLSRLAKANNRFLRSMCKILINKNVETIVNDKSIIKTNNIFQFNVITDKLVQNSILGYIPNIYDLKLNESLTLNDLNSPAETFYYELKSNTSCFHLNKFNGVLTIINKNRHCFINEITKLNVTIKSIVNEMIEINYGQILLVKVQQNLVKEELSDFVEINSNSANVLYDQSGSESEFELNFLLNRTEPMPEHVRLANLISNFKPDSAARGYKTQFEIVNKTQIFTMDTKNNAVYLNIKQEIELKCYSLQLTAKNFIYFNSIKRKLISKDSFKLNICFLNKEMYDFQIDSSDSFVKLILTDSITSFQQLLTDSNNRKKLINIAIIVSCFTVLALILVVSILLRRSKRVDQKCDESKLEANLSTVYSVAILNQHKGQNLSSTLNTTSTQSSSLEQIQSDNELQIRNDNSLYQQYYEPINNEKMYSSITNLEKESSEDQGVYCLATGTSFSLSSNISSVTSHCVDPDNNLNSTCKSPVVDKCRDLVSSFNGNNNTKLSLFDLTPQPLRLTKSKVLYHETNFDNNQDIYIAHQIIERSLARETNTRLSNEMQTWIYSNYVSNCVENKKEKISLSDENDSIDSAQFAQVAATQNECII